MEQEPEERERDDEGPEGDEGPGRGDLPVCGCGRTAGWRLVTRKAVTASDEEIAANPRSRSARLRCIERLPAAEA